MTQVERLADFANRASFDSLSTNAREQIKIRILDSLGCALGALDAGPTKIVRKYVDDLGAPGSCTLIGGGSARPDYAAFYNAALVRYLDFNDSYLAKGETCHPSDNLGVCLAAGEYAGSSGRELMAALAIAYQVQCRLSDEAPVRAKGFDHTVQGAYAATAAAGKLLRLDACHLANAIAISATALNALRVTRTGVLSNWKGLAYPYTGADCFRNAVLAGYGITGPLEVVEGNKGFIESIAGPFNVNWAEEDLDRVTRTTLKKYNAEIHSQTAIEAALQLRREHPIKPSEIDRIDLTTFEVAFNIIGGGEEGNKSTVRTKEQADHSLPYLISVALLDGQVMPEQYAPERILRPDVQALMKKVAIRPNAGYSARFPDEMPARITIALRNGQVIEREVLNCEGSCGLPMDRNAAYRKFEILSAPATSDAQRKAIAEMVFDLENHPVVDLMTLLRGTASQPAGAKVVVSIGRR
jgi:2-methylcitrate dehydratase